MPDIQTALQKALADKDIKSWSDENEPKTNGAKLLVDAATGKTKFGVSNNVMRESFEHVKQHPGLTTSQHVAMLEKEGFKVSSTTSVLSQLVRTGQLRKDEDRKLYAVRSEYAPMTTKLRSDHPQRKRKTKVEPTPTPTPTPVPRKKVILVKKGVGNTHHSSVGIAALGADGGNSTAKQPAQVLKAFHPSAIVDQLTVLHARELYDYLKKIFGGN